MPKIKYWVVTQTREVKVTANTAIDAGRIADTAFNNGQTSDFGAINGPEHVWGNTHTKIRTTDITIREDF